LEAMPSPAEAAQIGEAWRPYRTVASLFLWRSLHNAPL
jgi:DNA-3-methyladenine glycosylase II